MIAKLKGMIDTVGEETVIIDVGGVGYQVSCSAQTLRQLPAAGHPAVLLVETIVREDAIQLYGFASEHEQAAFRLLVGVQGVGARLALAILSTLPPHELYQAITLGDLAALSRASGVGKRLATRLATELKEKVAGDLSIPLTEATGGVSSGAAGDAVSALINLGYRPAEAHNAIIAATQTLGESADTEALIRNGLRELGR